jgi:seryl-tRNA synthetase
MVNRILLLIVVINFLLTLFFIYFIKQNHLAALQNNWREEQVDSFNPNDDKELGNKVENLKEDFQKLEFQSNHLEKDWQSMQTLMNDFDKKLMLIAAINNENVFVKRYGNEKDQLVYIQEDWTLSRTPSFVKLNDALKSFLPK